MCLRTPNLILIYWGLNLDDFEQTPTPNVRNSTTVSSFEESTKHYCSGTSPHGVSGGCQGVMIVTIDLMLAACLNQQFNEDDDAGVALWKVKCQRSMNDDQLESLGFIWEPLTFTPFFACKNVQLNHEWIENMSVVFQLLGEWYCFQKASRCYTVAPFWLPTKMVRPTYVNRYSAIDLQSVFTMLSHHLVSYFQNVCMCSCVCVCFYFQNKCIQV